MSSLWIRGMKHGRQAVFQSDSRKTILMKHLLTHIRNTCRFLLCGRHRCYKLSPQNIKQRAGQKASPHDVCNAMTMTYYNLGPLVGHGENSSTPCRTPTSARTLSKACKEEVVLGSCPPPLPLLPQCPIMISSWSRRITNSRSLVTSSQQPGAVFFFSFFYVN